MQMSRKGYTAAPPSDQPKPFIDPGQFAGKPRISKLSEIEWVYENIDVNVEIEDCPSAGSWSMLQHVRKNAMNRKEFYKDFVAKLIPPKNKLDQDGRHEDDGRETLRVLDAVEKELEGEVCSQCNGNGRV
jgi:hypothetical protein